MPFPAHPLFSSCVVSAEEKTNRSNSLGSERRHSFLSDGGVLLRKQGGSFHKTPSPASRGIESVRGSAAPLVRSFESGDLILPQQLPLPSRIRAAILGRPPFPPLVPPPVPCSPVALGSAPEAPNNLLLQIPTPADSLSLLERSSRQGS